MTQRIGPPPPSPVPKIRGMTLRILQYLEKTWPGDSRTKREIALAVGIPDDAIQPEAFGVSINAAFGVDNRSSSQKRRCKFFSSCFCWLKREGYVFKVEGGTQVYITRRGTYYLNHHHKRARHED